MMQCIADGKEVTLEPESKEEYILKQISKNAAKIPGAYKCVYNYSGQNFDWKVANPAAGVHKIVDIASDMFEREYQLNRINDFLTEIKYLYTGNWTNEMTIKAKESLYIAIDESNWYAKGGNFLRVYFINDLSKLSEEYKGVFPERGIYYELSEGSENLVGYIRITVFLYVELPEEFIKGALKEYIDAKTEPLLINAATVDTTDATVGDAVIEAWLSGRTILVYDSSVQGAQEVYILRVTNVILPRYGSTYVGVYYNEASGEKNIGLRCSVVEGDGTEYLERFT